jgi:hypothetical protein
MLGELDWEAEKYLILAGLDPGERDGFERGSHGLRMNEAGEKCIKDPGGSDTGHSSRSLFRSRNNRISLPEEWPVLPRDRVER